MNLEEDIKCQICKKSFKKKSILIHIGRSQHCHQEYPKTELEKLRSAANMRKLSQLKEIKRKTYNSQTRSDENKRHYENKKTEIRTKQQDYYKNHKSEIRPKQQDYYEANKKEVRAKQHEYQESKKTLAKFYEECQFGPIFPCICCKRCLPKRGVKIFQETFLENLKENKIESYVEMRSNLMIDGKFHICHSCHSNLSKKKMPNLCFKNGLQLANVPDCLQISSLGNQLLAKHLIFLKIRSLPKTGMGKMNDRVSNFHFQLHICTNSKSIYNFIGNQCPYC